MLSSCSAPDLAVAVQSQLSPGLCLLVTHSASLRKMESKESASFKYDVVSIIEFVESHPCLWDKTNKDNKNKIIREKSWKEIFQFLEDGCDVLNIEEKKKVADWACQTQPYYSCYCVSGHTDPRLPLVLQCFRVSE
ncbi:hypothetical protein J6590_107888 [Homalodisca vitripennis]|nr:hypothetical protein J6590_107888 [Homalodisca vitripennis]